ncbi:hypothetical protein DL93DRAFT_2026686, partial [Clavulina sp. PMI_390]
MPNPHSRDAPRFRGKHLRQFLEDYNTSANNAGWNDERKCEELVNYCSGTARDIVAEDIPEVDKRDWEGVKQRLFELYDPKGGRHRYPQQKLTEYTSKKRTITSQAEFADYRRGFSKIVSNLYPSQKLTPAERNRYFWRGIPAKLQSVIMSQLIARKPTMSMEEDPPYDEVSKIALTALNDKKKKSIDLDSDSDSESSSDEDSDSDSDSSDGSDDSDREYERSRRRSRYKSTKKKSSKSKTKPADNE